MIVAIIIGVVVVALVGLYISLNNGIITARNRVQNAWETIDAQLQRRSDLIPNLVETVKGYAAHESGTLQAVTNARAAVMGATTPEAKMAANEQLSGAIRNLFAVAEAYPDLKANTNFQQLQAELSNTEDKISYARMSYNDCVMKYNNAIQTFPGNLVAGMFGFKEKAGFSAAVEAATAPSVSFTSSAPTAPSGDYAPGTARQEAPGVSASGFRMTEPPDA